MKNGSGLLATGYQLLTAGSRLLVLGSWPEAPSKSRKRGSFLSGVATVADLCRSTYNAPHALAPRARSKEPRAKSRLILAALLLSASLLSAEEAKPTSISGIYPNLAMCNTEGECGTGAVVPWAGRLWVITYGPHCVKGSSDKLYEIAPDYRQIVRPESIGGTHANRMIHQESKQLFIGYHAISEEGTVRTIPAKSMPGRLTGAARHLTDPANKIYTATMEEGLYELDVKTLEVKELIRDGNVSDTKGYDLPEKGLHSKLPGYHGKGLFTGQGRLIYANNGERGNVQDPTIPSGALGEFRGEGDWQLVRRNQFTEVRGPGDISGGNPNPETDSVWALGWDYRSVILMLLDGGKWHAFRLPKGSHSYDGSHGWNTEWPRTRDIGEADMLGTMHGTFWHWPKTFSLKNSAGIAPRSNYLKVIGDFCRWNDRIVFGCDDSAKAEFLNTRVFKSKHGAPGQSISNLWFVDPAQLDHIGPVIGRGSVWIRDDVKAGTPSDPYLFAGFNRRMLHLRHASDGEVKFTLEVDRKGDNTWDALRTIAVPAKGYAFHIFTGDEKGAWVRLKTDKDAPQVAAVFQYANADKRPLTNDAAFAGISAVGTTQSLGGLIRALDFKTLGCVSIDLETGKDQGYYELDGALKLTKKDGAPGRAKVLDSVSPAMVYGVDAASVIVIEDNKRFRLPKNPAYVTQEPKIEKPAETPAEKPAQPAQTEQPNLALNAKVTVSSKRSAFDGTNAVDGKETEESRWVSEAGGEKWIALDLGEEREIGAARITTGLNRSPESVVKSMKLQIKDGEAWKDIPSATVEGNHLVVRPISFKETVRARHIRLVSEDESYVRIYEIALYAKPTGDAPPATEVPAATGALRTARVCREVATERDLFNCHGTFYELPARNASGFFKIRPIATHSLAIHDYASYRGLMLLTGLDPSALKVKSEHLIVSDDGQCALWAGAIDDLWKLGKARGEGGPWKDTAVQAGVPSDPYLMTGYDKKTLTLSHTDAGTINMTVEVDPDGTGVWCAYKTFAVEAGKPVTHEFPEGFNAYWVRVKADKACTATAQLKYE